MTSPDENVAPAAEEDKPRGELAVIAGRATEEQRLAIDLASARLALRRGHFLIAAAVIAAQAVANGDEGTSIRILELAHKMAA